MNQLPPLADLYTELAPGIARHVAGHFPRLCRGRVDDAVADTFVIAAASPSILATAYARGGLPQVKGLLHLIAWRCARGGVCRGASVWETSFDELPDQWVTRPPSQEILAEIHLHLLSTIEASSHEVCSRHGPAIAAALVDRLLSGEDDLTVARRHGVAREYLNQARRLAGQRLFGAA